MVLSKELSSSMTVKQLQAELQKHGVDTKGLKLKADYIRKIEEIIDAQNGQEQNQEVADTTMQEDNLVAQIVQDQQITDKAQDIVQQINHTVEPAQGIAQTAIQETVIQEPDAEVVDVTIPEDLKLGTIEQVVAQQLVDQVDAVQQAVDELEQNIIAQDQNIDGVSKEDKTVAENVQQVATQEGLEAQNGKETGEEAKTEGGSYGKMEVTETDKKTEEDVAAFSRNVEQEWHLDAIHENWRPMPYIRIKFVPDTVTEEEVKEMMGYYGIPVFSITVEKLFPKDHNKSLIVRILPQIVSEESSPFSGDDNKWGKEQEELANKLADEKKQKQEKLKAEASQRQEQEREKREQERQKREQERQLEREKREQLRKDKDLKYQQAQEEKKRQAQEQEASTEPPKDEISGDLNEQVDELAAGDQDQTQFNNNEQEVQNIINEEEVQNMEDDATAEMQIEDKQQEDQQELKEAVEEQQELPVEEQLQQQVEEAQIGQESQTEQLQQEEGVQEVGQQQQESETVQVDAEQATKDEQEKQVAEQKLQEEKIEQRKKDRAIERERREKEEQERKELEPIRDAKYYNKYNAKSLMPVETVSPEDLKDIRVDCGKFARFYVARLRKVQPLIYLQGAQLFFETPVLYSTLCIVNLPESWEDDKTFSECVSEHGKVERCFVQRNHKGESKGYGFVEYNLQSTAEKAKKELDKRFLDMYTQHKKKKQDEETDILENQDTIATENQKQNTIEAETKEENMENALATTSTSIPLQQAIEEYAEAVAQDAKTVDPIQTDGAVQIAISTTIEQDTAQVGDQSAYQPDDQPEEQTADQVMEKVEDEGMDLEEDDKIITDMPVDKPVVEVMVIETKDGDQQVTTEVKSAENTQKLEGDQMEKGLEEEEDVQKGSGQVLEEEDGQKGSGQTYEERVGKKHDQEKLDKQKSQIKVTRAEWCHIRTYTSLFSKNLYVANLPQNFRDQSALSEVFKKFGKVKQCQIQSKRGVGKGYAFVEYSRSLEADNAYRELDKQPLPDFGVESLLVTFVNPSKIESPPPEHRPSGGSYHSPSQRGYSSRHRYSQSRGGNYNGSNSRSGIRNSYGQKGGSYGNRTPGGRNMGGAMKSMGYRQSMGGGGRNNRMPSPYGGIRSGGSKYGGTPGARYAGQMGGVVGQGRQQSMANMGRMTRMSGGQKRNYEGEFVQRNPVVEPYVTPNYRGRSAPKGGYMSGGRGGGGVIQEQPSYTQNYNQAYTPGGQGRGYQKGGYQSGGGRYSGGYQGRSGGKPMNGRGGGYSRGGSQYGKITSGGGYTSQVDQSSQPYQNQYQQQYQQQPNYQQGQGSGYQNASYQSNAYPVQQQTQYSSYQQQPQQAYQSSYGSGYQQPSNNQGQQSQYVETYPNQSYGNPQQQGQYYPQQGGYQGSDYKRSRY